MLHNYIQNSNVGMTKDTYFEMCSMLGEDPVDSNIPVELDDFPLEVQHAFIVYKMMRDDWDGMTGEYLGKSFIGINELMDAVDVDSADRKFIMVLVRLIDTARSKEIKKLKTKPAS